MVHNYCQLASHDSIVLKEINNNKQRLVVHVHNTLFVAFDSNNIILYVLQLEKNMHSSGWISRQQNWTFFVHVIYSAQVHVHLVEGLAKSEHFIHPPLSYP